MMVSHGMMNEIGDLKLKQKIVDKLNILIACPSGPTIDTVSVKKTKHFELPETWLCVEKNKSPKYMRKKHFELSMKKTPKNHLNRLLDLN